MLFRRNRKNVQVVSTYNEDDLHLMREANLNYAARMEERRQTIALQRATRQIHHEEVLSRDEYTTVDKEIPPYSVLLHEYLDRVSFDSRFAPCLRINRKLVNSELELQISIEEFKNFNLLPTSVNLWEISHIDDLEFDDMIPYLIQENSEIDITESEPTYMHIPESSLFPYKDEIIDNQIQPPAYLY